MGENTLPEFPELPEAILEYFPNRSPYEWFDSWEEDYIRAYARSYAEQEVAKEREACAQIMHKRAELRASECDPIAFAAYSNAARVIRARSKP